jgi:hypothetical protein
MGHISRIGQIRLMGHIRHIGRIGRMGRIRPISPMRLIFKLISELCRTT